ncbi:hypothetical protein [Chromobacterium violaceum]|uniref:hypothetical protein n=1 Tax=Chromobacterium violaceum TaxID=536 RepID=UPI001C8BB747|nr:hypothetical protein [Chromobacterium violaceum]MBX9267255.1 hypothetical protein [Chromobacterium violaceum]
MERFMPCNVFYYSEKRDLDAWKVINASSPRLPASPIEEHQEFDSFDAAIAAEVPEKYGYATIEANGFFHHWSRDAGWVRAWPLGE